jgi:signal transduction histidine kinase
VEITFKDVLSRSWALGAGAPSRPGVAAWRLQAWRYLFATVLVAAAGILTSVTMPDHTTNSFEWFQAAVVLAAWYGGVGPGVVAAIQSSLVIDYVFLPPYFAFDLGPSDLVRVLIFCAVAILTSLLNGKLKRANADLTRGQRDLETKIRERTMELSAANRNLVQEIAQRNEAEQAILDVSNREQRRLGQDLHDGLSQTLAGVKLMTERVKRELQSGAPPDPGKVALIETRLAEALTFVETVSRGLYPVELESNGLMAALEELARNTGRLHPMDCRFRCPRPVAVSDGAVANHVFRIAQEAVANAVKHARAKRIQVRLTRRGARIVLAVADDGVGLAGAPARNGMGMKLMEHRARIMNGHLRVISGVRGGTVVRCSFPAVTVAGHPSHGG